MFVEVVDLMNTAKVNAYTMFIFGKTKLLSKHATLNHFKMHYLKDFQEANSYLSGNMIEI